MKNLSKSTSQPRLYWIKEITYIIIQKVRSENLSYKLNLQHLLQPMSKLTMKQYSFETTMV
jgi:predicted DNA-binding protein